MSQEIDLSKFSREELIALSSAAGERINKIAIRGKRYFAKCAGSRFCHTDGTETIFHFGRADIENPWHQKELDDILGKQTNIYIPDVVAPLPIEPVAMNAVSENELAESERKLVNARVAASDVGVTGNTDGRPTDVNQSTIDPNLQKAVMGDAFQGNMVPAGGISGPGADRLAQIRAAAAANTVVQPVSPEQVANAGASQSTS